MRFEGQGTQIGFFLVAQSKLEIQYSKLERPSTLTPQLAIIAVVKQTDLSARDPVGEANTRNMRSTMVAKGKQQRDQGGDAEGGQSSDG